MQAPVTQSQERVGNKLAGAAQPGCHACAISAQLCDHMGADCGALALWIAIRLNRTPRRTDQPILYRKNSPGSGMIDFIR